MFIHLSLPNEHKDESNNLNLCMISFVSFNSEAQVQFQLYQQLRKLGCQWGHIIGILSANGLYIHRFQAQGEIWQHTADRDKNSQLDKKHITTLIPHYIQSALRKKNVINPFEIAIFAEFSIAHLMQESIVMYGQYMYFEIRHRRISAIVD